MYTLRKFYSVFPFILIVGLTQVQVLNNQSTVSNGNILEIENGKISPGSCIGDPISATSGNMYYGITDVVINSDFGTSVKFERSYNSAGTSDGNSSPFGPKWTCSYGDFIDVTAHGWVTLHENTGRAVPFVNFNGPTDIGYKLEYNEKDDTYSILKPDNSVMKFNNDGKLAAVYDRNYIVVELKYKYDKLLQVKDPAGRSLNFSYNDLGRITSIKLQDGSTYCTYQYNTSLKHNLEKVTYADGSWESYKYITVESEDGLMSERCNSDGVCQFYTYDNLTRGTSNFGNDSVNFVRIEYTIRVRTNSKTKKEEQIFLTRVYGEDTVFYESQFVGNTGRRKLMRKINIGNPNKSLIQTFDSLGNKTSSKYGEEYADSLAFDSLSRQTYLWTGLDDKGFDSYTMRTYVPSRFNLEDIINISWGHRKKHTAMDLEYDKDGNVVGIIEYENTYQSPDLSPAKVRKAELSYNTKGQVKRFFYPSDEKDFEYVFEYYSNGDIKSISEGKSNTIIYGKRDKLGNCTWVKFSDGSESRFQYDERGRVIASIEVNPDGDSDTVQCKYNYEGKITELKSSDDSFITYTFDNHGWLVDVNSNVYGRTTYNYDKYGRIVDKVIMSPSGDTLLPTAYK